MLLPFIDYTVTVVSLYVAYNIHVYYMMFRVPYTVVLPFPPLQIWSRVFHSRLFSAPILISINEPSEQQGVEIIRDTSVSRVLDTRAGALLMLDATSARA